MTSTLKAGVKECIHNSHTHLWVDEASRQHNAIGIIMLTCQLRQIHIPAMRGTHTLMLVHSHAYTIATSADCNCRIHLAGLQSRRTRMSKISIITRLRRIRAEILIRDTLRIEPSINDILQFIARVITAQPHRRSRL